MKLLSSLAVILALILGLGFWSGHSLQTSTNELTRKIDQISETIEGEHWQTAQIKTAQLEDIWKEKAKWWPIFLDHQEMDNIDFSLARVKQYVASQDNALSMGQLSELRLMIEHIPKKEAVNIKNIL